MKNPFSFEEESFEFESEFDEYEEELDSHSEFAGEIGEFDTESADQEWEEERGRRFPIRRTRFRRMPRRRPMLSRGRPRRPGRRPVPPKYPRRPVTATPGPIVVFREPTIVEPEPHEPQGTEYVRWVQSSLNRILGLSLPVNGIMTPETRSAVRDFQRREGLPVDGIVGPETERALIAARASKTIGADDKEPAEPGEFEGFDTEFADSELEEEMNRSSEFDEFENKPLDEDFEWDEFFSPELEEEFRISNLPSKARDWFLKEVVFWPAAVQEAMKAGYRNLDDLTNMVFFMHHRERLSNGVGSPLQSTEPNFTKLSEEWKGWQTLIEPILKNASGVPPSPTLGPTVGPKPALSFTPVPVESPGGGRIKDKTEPHQGDLAKVIGYQGRKVPLHRLAAQALEVMIQAARADGIPKPLLELVSGYRSVAQQEKLWKIGLQKHGSAKEARKWIAPPGHSAHHSGRAVDLWMGLGLGKRNASAMRKGIVYKWMVDNAVRFGFYPYKAEPWHWEYNPPSAGQSELYAESYETFDLPDQYEDEGVDLYSKFDDSFEYEIIEPSEVIYDVEPGQPYGPRWRMHRPPGLPEHARLASKRGAALPYIELIARAQGLGEVFVKTLKHLAETESGGTFALPANIFDARPKEQRPTGKHLITAWGAFQFNRDAWRSLPDVASNEFPWDSTPYEEITRPILRYGKLFSDVIESRGSQVDAARGLRLWHRTPAGYARFLRLGRRQGFSSAWSHVDARHKTSVDKRLRSAGILEARELSSGQINETLV
jgi:D-alanyl-D-alanine carboxypeptidase/Putative peptidoglycan binding domain